MFFKKVALFTELIEKMMGSTRKIIALNWYRNICRCTLHLTLRNKINPKQYKLY